MPPYGKCTDHGGEVGEILEGIEVRGDAEFRARTRESLALLKQTPALALVQTEVSIIRQGKRSGMRAWTKKPTFVVGTATWRHSPLWYAGAIAHDAYHARLYNAAKRATGGMEPPANSWTGTRAERECLAFQHRVLQALHCDEKTLSYVSDWARRPAYQGRRRGLRGWLDYRRRWW